MPAARSGAMGNGTLAAVEGETSLDVLSVPIRGRSAAGRESYYRLPTLRSALELGRCPDTLVSIPTVFLSHAHLDHAAGIATYASQRTLQGLAEGRVHVPAETHDDFSRILSIHVRLEGFESYRASLVPLSAGDRVEIRNDLVAEAFAGSHRIPTLGFTFLDRRKKLKPELDGAGPSEIARARESGREISDTVETPILSYTGDCDAGIFEKAPRIFDSRILLIECTFLRPGEEERARGYGHLHLSDITARASEFRNDAIVLTHFSAKYSKDEILTRLADALPASIKERVTAFV
ncbi:MAG: MBL fold metallo-hydrolase [Thermoanaerobaculia bacterium]